MFRKWRRLVDLIAILGALAVLPDLWKAISPVAQSGFGWIAEHPASIIPVSFYFSAVLIKTYLISYSIPVSVKAFFRYGGFRANPTRDVILIWFLCVYTSAVLVFLLIPTVIHEGQGFWQTYPWRQVARTMKRETRSDWLIKAVTRWQRKR